jgi:hypothetical protein
MYDFKSGNGWTGRVLGNLTSSLKQASRIDLTLVSSLFCGLFLLGRSLATRSSNYRSYNVNKSNLVTAENYLLLT